MEESPHEEDKSFKKLFSDADAKIADAMKVQNEKETLNAVSYSYGGKEIAVTCLGCEAAIAKAESARKRLETFADGSGDSMMKEGLSKLVEIARRDEDQARARSLMHHHFPQSLLEYDALMK